MLAELQRARRCTRKLEAVCRDFELQRVCYLPLSTFLLKPLQRLVQYCLLLNRLCENFPPEHCDSADCHGERLTPGVPPRSHGGWGRCSLPYEGGVSLWSQTKQKNITVSA